MIVSLATRWRVSSDSGNLKIELRQPKAKFDMPIARKLGVAPRRVADFFILGENVRYRAMRCSGKRTGMASGRS